MPEPLLTTHIACPCTDIYADPSNPAPIQEAAGNDVIYETESQPFNPRLPRANYALYPQEHLLFCTDCHEIRCHRCYVEEALTYFCPRCLVERPAYEVKSESNRCPQSCHDCPLCFGALITARYEDAATSGTDSFILSCPHCGWSTLEIGIKFPRSVRISDQLAKVRNCGETIETTTEMPQRDAASQDATRFYALANFYKNQLEESQPRRDSSLYTARLLSTRGAQALRAPSKPETPMREALTQAEGLLSITSEAENGLISRMAHAGFNDITSASQQAHQTSPDTTGFPSDLRPIPVSLHTKSVKKCRTCRKMLVRPDTSRGKTAGMSTSRYVFRKVAFEFVPRIALKPLETSTNLHALPPGIPVYFLATFVNPLTTLVKVTLGTPRITPGLVESRVTILCPQFELDARNDSFDATASSTARAPAIYYGGPAETQPQQQPEAGKVWAKNKNRTTVVIEVVPGTTRFLQSHGSRRAAGDGSSNAEHLEVPVFVRLDYETEADTPAAVLIKEQEGKASRDGLEGGGKVARELAYWCVLGLGRIG